MNSNPILEAIRNSYVRHAEQTEQAVFSMLMTKSVKDKIDLDNLNLMELFKTIHEASMKNSSVSFREGELVISKKYEIHSVSANRNEEGDSEVWVNMFNLQTEEVSSKRISEIMNITFLLEVVEKVNEKCELTFNLDEDEN